MSTEVIEAMAETWDPRASDDDGYEKPDHSEWTFSAEGVGLAGVGKPGEPGGPPWRPTVRCFVAHESTDVCECCGIVVLAGHRMIEIRYSRWSEINACGECAKAMAPGVVEAVRFAEGKGWKA